NGNIGATQSVANLTIDTAAGGVTFGGGDAASTGAGGPVATINTDGSIDIGTGNNPTNVIGGTGITLNGGTGTLTLQTTNDNVRLNGATNLFSNVRIDTGSGAGDVVLTNDSPINSQPGEFNNLTINTGLGAVRFSEDIGAMQRLGALTIENASQ